MLTLLGFAPIRRLKLDPEPPVRGFGKFMLITPPVMLIVFEEYGSVKVAKTFIPSRLGRLAPLIVSSPPDILNAPRCTPS